MKREIFIYFTILIIAAPLMHGEKLIDNFFKALDNPAKFGHPLIYTALIYLVILFLRFVIKEIVRVSKKVFAKKDS